jgi:hypothetical protein
MVTSASACICLSIIQLSANALGRLVVADGTGITLLLNFLLIAVGIHGLPGPRWPAMPGMMVFSRALGQRSILPYNLSSFFSSFPLSVFTVSAPG